jgi:hypothetical protein
MTRQDWSREEVEAIVEDYLAMLGAELARTPYNKGAHRKALLTRLSNRSAKSIEFKHANISAALLDAGFPYIKGYKPLSHYQTLLAEVLGERLEQNPSLLQIAAADADSPMAVPEVSDILSILTERPRIPELPPRIAREAVPPVIALTTNYIEREARNRSLGNAGELFILEYERARLIRAGHERLATRIEHTAKVRGDHAGYDILSFEESGAERLIEVKTTKYGGETPFYVTRNEVATSERQSRQYQVYRLFAFRESPRLYTLSGAIDHTCRLTAATFLAIPK